jgi:hypothetical protein
MGYVIMDSESLRASSEPQPTASQTTPADAAHAAPTDSPAGAPSTHAGLRAGPLLGLLAAVVAGTLGWGLVEQVQPVFSIGEGYEIPSLGAPPEMFERSRAAHAAVAQKNAAFNLALLGGLLALGLATAEAGLRRTWILVAAAPLLGLVLGGLGGYLGGHLHGTLLKDGSMTELTNVIKVHALMLVPLGMGVGLAMGLITTVPKTIATAAIVGGVTGVIAAVTYTLIISLAFSTIATEDLLPITPFGRFVWTLVAATLLGLLIPAGARK